MKNNDIVRVELDTITIPNGGTTEVTIPWYLNGVIRTMVSTINNTTNSVTATVAIKDEGDLTIYSVGSLAENTSTTTTDVDAYCAGQLTIGVTPSGDPGASTMTVDLVIYADRTGRK